MQGNCINVLTVKVIQSSLVLRKMESQIALQKSLMKTPRQKIRLHIKKEQVKKTIEELIHDAIQFQAI